MIALLLLSLIGPLLSQSVALPTIPDTNWEIKGAADLDNDGRLDLVWRHKVTGQNIVWILHGSVLVAAKFLPTIADLDWDIVSVSQSSGVIWHHRLSGQNVAWAFEWVREIAPPVFIGPPEIIVCVSGTC